MAWGTLLQAGLALLPTIVSGVKKIFGDKGSNAMKTLGSVAGVVGKVGSTLSKAKLLPKNVAEYTTGIGQVGEMINDNIGVENNPDYEPFNEVPDDIPILGEPQPKESIRMEGEPVEMAPSIRKNPISKNKRLGKGKWKGSKRKFKFEQ